MHFYAIAVAKRSEWPVYKQVPNALINVVVIKIMWRLKMIFKLTLKLNNIVMRVCVALKARNLNVVDFLDFI